MTKEQLALKDYLGDKVYILGPKSEDTEELEFGEIVLSSFSVTIIDELMDYDAEDPVIPAVIHGVVCPATALPSSLEGVGVFVVVTDDSESVGSIIPMDAKCTTDDIALLVTNLASSVDDGLPIPIEQIYVLYGYELHVKLTINGDDEDDEALGKAEEIAAEIEELTEAIKEVSIEEEN